MLSASVTVDQQVVSSIGKGILVLAAIAPGDTEKDVESMANKILKLKLWDDESGGRVIFFFNALCFSNKIPSGKRALKTLTVKCYVVSLMCFSGAMQVQVWANSSTDVQSRSLHFLLPQKRATSPTFMVPLEVKKPKGCTSASIVRLKGAMFPKESRMVCSRP